MAAVTPRPSLPPGPFLVVGLARSGLAVAQALAVRGHVVIGTDTRPPSAGARAALDGAGVVVDAPGNGLAALDRVETVVKSPGVPQTAPVVAAARARGARVVGELELAWRLLPNPFVAVTGSNGKTTTVELLGHLHRVAGVPVAVAGNVGTPLSSLAGALDPGVVIACEASSFQLEDTEAFAPDAAILLNVTADHLDRHGTLAAYREAKLRIFARQPAGAVRVAPDTLDVAGAGGDAAWVRFGTAPGSALRVDGDVLRWHEEPVVAVGELALRGAHNLENAMAAAAACLARGMAPAAVAEGLRTFAGVPHRLEEVARRDGVLYVNDSKATNVASAVVALRSFSGGIHVILGGQGKGADFTPLAAAVRDRARAAYLIGEDAEAIAAALAGAGVPLTRSGDLERAVADARAAARPGDVVLLSPACASFDQFASYEHRGDRFRTLARG
jgi:UDP-N-acetylmuramoylalanine--D-glutamate ligase